MSSVRRGSVFWFFCFCLISLEICRESHSKREKNIFCKIFIFSMPLDEITSVGHFLILLNSWFLGSPDKHFRFLERGQMLLKFWAPPRFLPCGGKTLFLFSPWGPEYGGKKEFFPPGVGNVGGKTFFRDREYGRKTLQNSISPHHLGPAAGGKFSRFSAYSPFGNAFS